MIKLFAHRGYINSNLLNNYNSKKEKLENSIASLNNAVKNNFSAIEFDLWWFENRFLLKHNCPTKLEIATKNYLPQLFEYFIYKNQIEYWLDFKNLNQKNCQNAIKNLKKTIEELDIDFDKCHFAPFINNKETTKVILDNFLQIFGQKINFVALCEFLNEEDLEKLAEFLLENNIKFLSIDHKLITQKIIDKLKNTHLMAWTVNCNQIFNHLLKMGVKTFATDTILTVNNG